MELLRSLTTSAVRFMTAQNTENVFVPDLIRGIQDRYRFWSAPAPSDLNQPGANGAKFTTGRFEDINLSALIVYNNGVLVEGPAHSSRLDSVLDDLADWVSNTYGVTYTLSEPLGKGFTSSVEVASDVTLGERFRELDGWLQLLTLRVASYGITLANYQPSTLIFLTEQAAAKPVNPGRFMIEQRTGHPLGSKVYFSEAPVSTDEHMELLNALEAIWTSASAPPPARSRRASRAKSI